MLPGADSPEVCPPGVRLAPCAIFFLDPSAETAIISPVPGRGGSSERRPRCLIAGVTLTSQRREDAVYPSYRRTTQALDAFRTLVIRWPGDAPLLHDLAAAARVAGRTGEATRAEEAALAVDGNSRAALNGLGLLQVDAGRFGEAAASFERATALEPSDPSFWTNLGNARRELRDAAGAAAAYQRALAIDGEWPDAANGLGVLLVQGNRASEAVSWFDRALARSPGFVEARLNLGIACQQAGQLERARASYRAILGAHPGFRAEKEAARKLLEGLGR